MTLQYIKNRYIIEDIFVIHDNTINKHVCVCATPEIAQYLVTLLNKEPHNNGSSGHDISTI